MLESMLEPGGLHSLNKDSIAKFLRAPILKNICKRLLRLIIKNKNPSILWGDFLKKLK